MLHAFVVSVPVGARSIGSAVRNVVGIRRPESREIPRLVPPKKRTPENTPLIGWREWVRLPELGIDAIKAKVDTGARSSALHAFDIRYVDKKRIRMVRFKVHPFQGDTRTTVETEAELVDERLVRSSSGKQSLRPVIVTEVALSGELWPIELTLVGRDEMGFRMLLGRQAVRRRFLINPAVSFLAGRDPTKKKAPSGSKKRTKRKAR